jgi:16S rRNA (guanine966-N2)-methyltransferase
MRIIAGKYKGRTISTIEGNETRPVMDRIKESIFNILTHRYSLIDMEILDLFAGSGSFGLEALSRGAKSVTFVEKSAQVVKHLQSNIDKLKCNEQCAVNNISVESFLEKNKKKFDIVFFDPPFKILNPFEIICQIYKNNILSEDSILIFRTEKKNKLMLNHNSSTEGILDLSLFVKEGVKPPSAFQAIQAEAELEKIFGRNIVYFLRPKNSSSAKALVTEKGINYETGT